MRVFLPAAVLLFIHLTSISIGAPVAIPAPTAQPSNGLPKVEDRSLSDKATKSSRSEIHASKAKVALGQPTDYAHVDLEGMIGDLVIPSEHGKTNSSSETTSTMTKTKVTA